MLTATMDMFNVINNPFVESKKRFISCLNNVDLPLTYDMWLSLDDQYKAVALFVNFFDEITLAYYKAQSLYSEDEDNISIVLQYLEKNVDLIKENPKKYNEKYIYRVAYNCMYCQCRDIKRDRLRFENTVSNITCKGEEEYDAFDFIGDDNDAISEMESNKFWDIIDNLTEDERRIVEHLLDGKRLTKDLKERYDDILEGIQYKLSDYRLNY